MESKTIKELRNERGLKQRFVAEKIGMSPAYYSIKENGKRPWTLNEARKLCQFFKVSIEELNI